MRIDNSVLPPVGPAHAVDERTQTNWNGIVRIMELRATDPVWIDDIQVCPNAAERTAQVIATIGNITGNPASGKITVASENYNTGATATFPTQSVDFNAPDEDSQSWYNIEFTEMEATDSNVSLFDFGKREGELIFRHYGNSPSFILFTLGNELGMNASMAKMVAHFQKINPLALHAQGSNNMHWNPTLPEGDDFWVMGKLNKEDKPLRGSFAYHDYPNPHIEKSPPSTTVDFSHTIDGVPVPMIGQVKWDVIHFNWGLWDLCYRRLSRRSLRRSRRHGHHGPHRAIHHHRRPQTRKPDPVCRRKTTAVATKKGDRYPSIWLSIGGNLSDDQPHESLRSGTSHHPDTT